MAAPSISSASTPASSGLRTVQLRNDLGKIADLLEIAFGDTIDTAGMSAVREMRALSQLGPLLWIIARLDRGIRAMSHGYVWVDPATQRLIGNVSIYDAGFDQIMVIANVAVHPDFRRRGIAEAMMIASMEAARRHHAKEVLLQVDASNLGAQKLYEKLGFQSLGTFTRWQWYPDDPDDVPLRRPGALDIKRRTGREWKLHYQLAQQVRPDTVGGVGWLRPTRPRTFRRTTGQLMWAIMGVESYEHWAVHHPDHPDQLLAALSMRTVFGARNRHIELLLHPDAQSEHARDMITFAMRQVADLRRGLILEYPSDDDLTNNLLYHLRFEPKRRLLHMRWCPE